ncbi:MULTISPECIES: VWA domain-containing protein [Gammaproteobacteria]|uniref:VWA domain-containing protein n=1 Tax=Gammaproteobacteria TaxID=1236 RepID=UPI001402FF27|nr:MULTISPECIES: VWA domain-containing protein [Gammaproteobacteria]
MFEFAWPWVWVLLPVPVIYWFIKPWSRSGQRFSFPNIKKRALGIEHNVASRKIKYLFPLWVWALLVAGMSQPRWVGEPIPVEQEAREILVAMDLSGSMQVDDMVMQGQRVTRLYAAHSILADFIRRRTGDRVGLVLYADSAHLYVPVTSDLETVAELAEEAEIGLVGQRTALGDAIGISIRYFLEREAEQKVVIMLTDGMVNSGNLDAEDAIQLAQSNDVKIYTVGIGADEMLVSGLFGNRRINPSQELNEVFLQQVAEVTDGEYFRARSAEDMERIYETLDQLEPVQSDEQFFRPFQSLTHWFIILALVSVLLFEMFRAIRWRRFK